MVCQRHHPPPYTKATSLLLQQIRGGGIWGRRTSNAGVDEYEYEYEYYEEEDGGDTENEYYEDEVLQDVNYLATSTNNKEEEDYDDDEYLFTTPIPTATNNEMQSKKKPAAKQESAAEQNRKGNSDNVKRKGNNKKKQKKKTKSNGENYDDYLLLETPVNQSSNTAKKTRRRQGSRSTKSQWRPTSSSRTSFIPPFNKSSGKLPSLSIRSINIQPLYSGLVSTISTVLAAIVRPIGNGIQSVSYALASTVSKWLSVSWLYLCDGFDYLWYGPVDGVSTAGITFRNGGLKGLMFGSPIGITLSSIVVLGLATVIISKIWSAIPHENGDDDEEEDDYMNDPMEPPSVEEELRFLNRDFEAANPSSTERIAKVIVKEDRMPWSKLRHRRRAEREDKPNTRKRQIKQTVKNIQQWWKDRPQRAISIIEPQHLRNPQRSNNQEIKQLRRDLTASENERAILQQDVERLKQKLQRSNNDARSINSQNKYLENQTSKADQILNNAVEVERRKSNNDVRKVQDSMQEVLERERRMMRSRFAETTDRRDNNIREPWRPHNNDLDFNGGRRATRQLDGVKIVQEIDQIDGKDVDGLTLEGM